MKDTVLNKDETNLNGIYTFENFKITDSTYYALQATQIVAESKGEYNPFFVYGNKGTYSGSFYKL